MTTLVARKQTPAKPKAIPKAPIQRPAETSGEPSESTPIFKQASLPEWLMLAVFVFAVSFYVYTSFPRGSDPQPKPTPTPVVPVPNEYNVGKVAYSEAPKDAAMAKQIAGWYKSGAVKLFGQGSLADIESITKEINAQFAAKQCKDQATCAAWDKWKAAVSKASIDEQTKRGTFTRQDWFAVLNEVATALEAVK